MTARRVTSQQQSLNIAPPGPIPVAFVVNGVERHIFVAPCTTLLDALRENLGLLGTKKGCDHGQCGACTVLVNGRRVNSCLALAVMKEGATSPPSRGLLRTVLSIPCSRRSLITTLSSAGTARRADLFGSRDDSRGPSQDRGWRARAYEREYLPLWRVSQHRRGYWRGNAR